jgi:hypothetical protein
MVQMAELPTKTKTKGKNMKTEQKATIITNNARLAS